MRVRKALLSVWDKKGIVEFAKKLVGKGVEVIATGGTSRELEKNSIPHTKTEKITGFTELLGGKVKTLHPKIFASVLATPEEAEKEGIERIELLVVNLYPPEKEPDIGGVSLIRAGLKNWKNVAVVVDPADYDTVALQIANGNLPDDVRDYLNRKAMRYVLEYQLQNSLKYFNFDVLPFLFEKMFSLRYGQNPWSEAEFFSPKSEPKFEILKGDISQNNLQDASSAMECALTLKERFPDHFCVVVVKHQTPCGVALGKTPAEALRRAFEADEKSAFGGVVAMSDIFDTESAKFIKDKFVDVIVAREFFEDAMEILVQKRARIIRFDGDLEDFETKIFSAFGGIVVEKGKVPKPSFKPAWEFEFSERDLKELEFAFLVSYFAKSNAVVITSGFQTVGIGAGAVSRVDASHFAKFKLEEYERKFGKPEKLYASSDGFFPFPDSIDVLADAGVQFICQPGGSKRDEEVIARAKEKGVKMFLTGVRVFRH